MIYYFYYITEKCKNQVMSMKYNTMVTNPKVAPFRMGIVHNNPNKTYGGLQNVNLIKTFY